MVRGVLEFFQSHLSLRLIFDEKHIHTHSQVHTAEEET